MGALARHVTAALLGLAANVFAYVEYAGVETPGDGDGGGPVTGLGVTASEIDLGTATCAGKRRRKASSQSPKNETP